MRKSEEEYEKELIERVKREYIGSEVTCLSDEMDYVVESYDTMDIWEDDDYDSGYYVCINCIDNEGTAITVNEEGVWADIVTPNKKELYKIY